MEARDTTPQDKSINGVNIPEGYIKELCVYDDVKIVRKGSKYFVIRGSEEIEINTEGDLRKEVVNALGKLGFNPKSLKVVVITDKFLQALEKELGKVKGEAPKEVKETKEEAQPKEVVKEEVKEGEAKEGTSKEDEVVDEVLEGLKEELGLKPEGVVLCKASTQKGVCELAKVGFNYMLRCDGKELSLNLTNLDNDTIKEMVRLGLMTLGVEGLDLFNLTQEFTKALVDDVGLIRELKNALEGKPNIAKISSDLVKYFKNQYLIKTPVINDAVLGVYCYKEGYYEECEEELGSKLNEVYNTLNMEEKGVKYKSLKAEFLTQLIDNTKVFRGFNYNLILFKNGVFDWEVFFQTGDLSRSLTQPNPELMVVHRIPHKLALEKLKEVGSYNNLEELASKLCPKSLKTFKEWVGDKWLLLFEIIGFTLYPKYDLHKAVMLVGDGKNGKGTYLRLIETVLSHKNITSIPLQDLTSEKFASVQLLHKLANIYKDLPKKPLTETGAFKILTGEDWACWDEKYRRKRVCFTNYAKLIFSTNELPKTYDLTTAFWRRWLVINFPNQFPLNPKFFEETFTEDEIEGVIIVSLLAFRDVWLRRKFSFEETEADYKELWLREVNVVYAFYQDLLSGKLVDSLGVRAEKDPNGRVEAKKFYQLFSKYCEIEDRECPPKKTFTEELGKFGIISRPYGGYYYYVGIKLIEEKKEEKPNDLENWF